MDAYSSYILTMSQARTDELRREAAEYALSRATRGGRRSLWTRARARLTVRAGPPVEPVAPVPLPALRHDEELRRSA